MIYTITRETEYTDDLKNFIETEGFEISKMFDGVFNHHNAAVELLIKNAVFLVGRRDGEIRGLHVSWLFKSPLDTTVSILQQQIFYVKPDSGRTAFLLFDKFIDIGKNEANHIITMLTRHTNIKPETLNKLGFEEKEVMYRMEIK